MEILIKVNALLTFYLKKKLKASINNCQRIIYLNFLQNHAVIDALTRHESFKIVKIMLSTIFAVTHSYTF